MNTMGKPIALTENTINTLNRFVLKGEPDDCWPWTGCKTRRGYGKLGTRSNYGNKYYYAHRVAYVLEYGPFDWELEVCHRCDNPPCCNPNHLFLGTRLDNVRDCVIKGRHLKGEKCNWSKLTQGDANRIRDLYYFDFTQQEIAWEYNISRANVWSIINHKSWS